MHFVKLHRLYLFGKKFLIRTDHGALKYLFNFKDSQGQMARWLQVLHTYRFNIEHMAGRKHGNADAMSRGPCRQCGDKQCILRVVTRLHKEREDEEGRKVRRRGNPGQDRREAANTREEKKRFSKENKRT